MPEARQRRRGRAIRRTSTWSFLADEKPRKGLSREAIVDAAVDVADAEGLEAISMRLLARQLKASPMALYHYVGSKADLLNLMRDKTYEEVRLEGHRPSDWHDLLSLFAWRNRELFLKHKWLIHLPAEQRQYGPEAIRVLEWYLEKMRELNIDLGKGVGALEILLSFTIGFVSRERLNSAGKKEKTSSQDLFSPQVLALGKFPQVVALVEKGIEPASDAAFARSLEWVLNGIASEMPDARSKRAKAARQSSLLAIRGKTVSKNGMRNSHG